MRARGPLLRSLARERDGKLLVPERQTQQDIADRVGASRAHDQPHFQGPDDRRLCAVVDRQITLNRRPPPCW